MTLLSLAGFNLFTESKFLSNHGVEDILIMKEHLDDAYGLYLDFHG